jgi:hypothetical protein
MSRGKPSKKAFAAAVPVAQARGQVIFLRHYPGTTSDFLISEPSWLTVVTTRRSRRVHAMIDEIARKYHETLAGIRSAEHPPGVDREFWLWSPYGTMRFFWIEGSVMVEIDRSGVPLNPPVSATISAQKIGGSNAAGKIAGEQPAGKNPGEPDPGKKSVPEKFTVPGAGAQPPGIPGPASAAGIPGPAPAAGVSGSILTPGPAVPREPAPVRYLRRRARERREAKIPPGTPGPGVPGGGRPPG